jgi:hypothetical protein
MNTANEELLFKGFEMYCFNKHNTIQAQCDADCALRCLRFNFIHPVVHSFIPPEAKSSHLVLLEPQGYGKRRGWYEGYQVCDKVGVGTRVTNFAISVEVGARVTKFAISVEVGTRVIKFAISVEVGTRVTSNSDGLYGNSKLFRVQFNDAVGGR